MPLKFDSITADVFRLERSEKGLQLSVDDFGGAVLLPAGKLTMLAEFLTEAGRIMEDQAAEPVAAEPVAAKKPGRKKKTEDEDATDTLGDPDGEFVSTRVTAIFRFECRCGEDYLQKKNETVNWAICRNCQSKLYTDRSRGQEDTEKGPAWVMTNKYFVNKDMQIPPQSPPPQNGFTIAELTGAGKATT